MNTNLMSAWGAISEGVNFASAQKCLIESFLQRQLEAIYHNRHVFSLRLREPKDRTVMDTSFLLFEGAITLENANNIICNFF